MSTLERAIAIAVAAHAGQFDKAGRPYILHPLRVMLALDTTDDQIVGVLHDVVEDTDVTLEGLRAEGFSEVILAGLESVTKREGEDYPAFVPRGGQPHRAQGEAGRSPRQQRSVPDRPPHAEGP